MELLIAGLVLFLGIHSIRIWGESLRTRGVERWGALGWKIGYSVVSLAGFALLVVGYGIARKTPSIVWVPPTEIRFLTYVLTLATEILVVATYLPRNRLKAAVGHPMLLGIMCWSLAHLASNGTAHGMLVFVSFLVWAILAFVAARARDRCAGVSYESGPPLRTVKTVAMGVVNWAVIGFFLHGWLIGPRPFG